MRKNLGRRLLIRAVASAATVALGVGATPSIASTVRTWTVKPGGKFTGSSAGKIVLRDTKTGVVLACKSASVSGKLKSGGGLPGTGIGSITAFAVGSPLSCTNGVFDYTWTFGYFPYHLNAASYDMSHGEATMTLTRLIGAMSGSGCTATIGGRTAAARGQVEGKYTNRTHKLQIVTNGSTLHLYNVSAGCLGLWNTGDHMTISGTYTLNPAQTITSP